MNEETYRAVKAKRPGDGLHSSHHDSYMSRYIPHRDSYMSHHESHMSGDRSTTPRPYPDEGTSHNEGTSHDEPTSPDEHTSRDKPTSHRRHLCDHSCFRKSWCTDSPAHEAGHEEKDDIGTF